MIKIKQHRNRNHYLLTDTGLWVRDFTKIAPPVDINHLIKRHEYSLLIENENNITNYRIPHIDNKNLPTITKAIIISDGMGFNEAYQYIEQLPNDVIIIGVNRSLAKWPVTNGIVKRRMDFYLVNNPYNECLSYLPSHNYRPKLIASLRTNHNFIRKYRGSSRYVYAPSPSFDFGSRKKHSFVLDDYRNPICAALSFLYHCGIKKVGLLCCEDVLPEQRPAAEKVAENKWIYPQQRIAHNLIDGMLYWLTHQEDYPVDVIHYPNVLEYKNSKYIVLEDLIDAIKESP